MIAIHKFPRKLYQHSLLLLSLLCALALTSTTYADSRENPHADHHGQPHADKHEEHHHDSQADDLDESHTEHAAHVHGLAQLLVVLEGSHLDIAFISPAMNLLGFEHTPSSDEDHAQVARAKAILADSDQVFRLTAGACELVDYEADFDSNANADDVLLFDDEEEFEEHKHHHENEVEHQDIEAMYRYHCKQPQALKTLSTRLPNQFPGIHSLQVEWIIEGSQGAAKLDARQNYIDFK